LSVAPILGALSDRFGRRPVLLISLFGLAFDYLVMAFAPTLWWLFVARVGPPASPPRGSRWPGPTSPTWWSRTSGPATFGLMGAAWGVGFIVGPAIGGFLAQHFGLRAPFMGAAALTLLGALYGLFVLPESLKREKPRAVRLGQGQSDRIAELPGRAPRTVAAVAGEHAAADRPLRAADDLRALCLNRYGWTVDMTGYALALTGICNIIVQGLLVRSRGANHRRVGRGG
jgi:DHA1 family tetracycline resistance protein-like MFS transporter